MDELIRRTVIDQLRRDDRLDASRLTVEVKERTVTLKGEVSTGSSKKAAHEDAEGIVGVTGVKNQLHIKPRIRIIKTHGKTLPRKNILGTQQSD
jgi:osmotically-inducible protein OsmY